MKNSLIKLTGMLAIAGLIVFGCDSVVDNEPMMPNMENLQSESLSNLTSSNSGIIVVTPEDLMGWEEDNVRGDGVSEITDEVPDPYGGNGALAQSFSDKEGKTDFRYVQLFGPANELTELSFDWYRDGSSTAPGHLTPAIGLIFRDIAGEGNSWLLKWEGVYNDYPTSGPAAPTDEWVTENLLDANFWRIPQFVDGFWVGMAGCNEPGDPYECFQFDRSLDDEWLEGFELIVIEVGIGSGWDGTFLSYVDYITINDTTFDFELAALDPTSRMDCLNGGWEEFGFRNQGQCIRYVNTGMDSR